MRQTFFIGRLEEPRSDYFMNLNCRPDNLLRESVHKYTRPQRLIGEISIPIHRSDAEFKEIGVSFDQKLFYSASSAPLR